MSECSEDGLSGPAAAVDLSVCVCTFNRADDLAFALESLARLRVPQGRSVEFIIVDNASTDATPAVLSAAAARFPFPLKAVQEPIRGSGAAHNCALRHARGDVIAWTDDDCVPAEDWVERTLAHFDGDPTLEILTGRIELYDQSHYPITINTSLEPADVNFVLGANMAFRRRLPERIGVFDPRFGAGAPLRAAEDAEFAFRALRGGSRIAYTPDVLLYHNHKRVTHDQVMRLRRNYTYGEGAMLMKHLLAGDGTAARRFYWSLYGIIRRILRPSPSIPARADNAKLLLEFFAGALAYLRVSMPGSRVPGPRRKSRSAGSAAWAAPAVCRSHFQKSAGSPDSSFETGRWRN
jgi:GT2 family glycosyltransferase